MFHLLHSLSITSRGESRQAHSVVMAEASGPCNAMLGKALKLSWSFAVAVSKAGQGTRHSGLCVDQSLGGGGVSPGRGVALGMRALFLCRRFLEGR